MIILGMWLTFVQAKGFAKGKPDTLGGNVSLLIIGIGLVGIGIMFMFQ